jgi:hypothetical protein
MALTYCSFVSQVAVAKERNGSYINLDVLVLKVEGMLPDIYTDEGCAI